MARRVPQYTLGRARRRMEPAAIGIAQVNAASFPKAARLVRDCLSRQGLTIVAEQSADGSGRTLCVVCPFLLFETLAFDASAAVFVPARVAMRPSPLGAEVRWLTAAAFLPVRLAAGGVGPVQALHERIGAAIRTLEKRRRMFLFRPRRRNEG